MPKGAKVNGETGDVTLNGAVVAHHSDECPYATIRPSGATLRPSGGVIPASGINNWVEDTFQQAPTGHAWDEITTVITVPPVPPSDWVGQTLFYFPGWTTDLSFGTNCGILQPVLQYGNSAAGGACGGSSGSTNCWYIASWHVTTSGGYDTSLVSPVNAGDNLAMSMELYGVSGGNYEYSIEADDTTLGAIETLYWDSACIYDQAFPAAFEAYGLTACNQMPYNYENNTSISLYAAIANWNTYTSETYSPTNQLRSTSFDGGTSNDCSFAVGNSGTTTTLWQ